MLCKCAVLCDFAVQVCELIVEKICITFITCIARPIVKFYFLTIFGRNKSKSIVDQSIPRSQYLDLWLSSWRKDVKLDHVKIDGKV